MKFGEYLKQAAVPEWQSQYIDYKKLKDILDTFPPKLARTATSNVLINAFSNWGSNTNLASAVAAAAASKPATVIHENELPPQPRSSKIQSYAKFNDEAEDEEAAPAGVVQDRVKDEEEEETKNEDKPQHTLQIIESNASTHKLLKRFRTSKNLYDKELGNNIQIVELPAVKRDEKNFYVKRINIAEAKTDENVEIDANFQDGTLNLINLIPQVRF
jgi:hypothetical protein